ncbi:hypothetical protein ACFOEY_06805 [Paracandidimonas soli]|uniref:hypothetical protein n=1 Tax=Paracandidimonas soli TaxID=1917182 RepID=UPI0036141E7A
MTISVSGTAGRPYAVTTRSSASLVVHDEVKRGSAHTAPQAPPYGGEEAPGFRRERLTFFSIKRAGSPMGGHAAARWIRFRRRGACWM